MTVTENTENTHVTNPRTEKLHKLGEDARKENVLLTEIILQTGTSPVIEKTIAYNNMVQSLTGAIALAIEAGFDDITVNSLLVDLIQPLEADEDYDCAVTE